MKNPNSSISPEQRELKRLAALERNGKITRTLDEKFFSKVYITSGCWYWTGSKLPFRLWNYDN